MPCGNPKPIEWDVNERSCHICTSHAPNGDGYPMIGVWRDGKIHVIKVVKYLWEQQNGPVPDGLWLLHECDDRACINLEHVHLGTHTDNMREMHVRGRATKTIVGNTNKRKLTLEIGKDILTSMESCAVIGRRLGKHRTYIWYVRSGKRYEKFRQDVFKHVR